MIKIIKYFFQAIFVYLFFLIGILLGLNISRRLFSFIFKKIGPMIKSKEIINKNLLNFSNKLSIQQKRSIIDNMWSNYGMTFIEYMFLNKFRKNNLHINISGQKILNQISKNKKPVIFVSGHFANFELMSMEIEKSKIKLATIYRPVNNFFINFYMEYLRKKYICKNQIKKGRAGVREAIYYIKNKYSIALMIDQRVSEGEKIKFFDKQALTTTLPAQLALKFNIDIIPIFIERKKNNLFNIKVHKPITINKNKKKFEISRKLNEILESMIKKNPNQWIWTHNRWK